MNVAWITHRRDWDSLGGAEMCDRLMAVRRPSGIKLTVMFPGGVDQDLWDFDHVIVSGFYGFSARELNIIQDVGHKTTMWVHDSQMLGHWLYTVVKNLIFVTPMHRDHDLKPLIGFENPNVYINPGWMDIEELMASEQDFMDRKNALWAARPAGHKGLDLAVDWAKEHDVRLDVLVGRPRSEVLQAMSRHQYFVLLSHIFDSGPRAVIEAQLLGCELVLNDNVGWFDEPPVDLAARLQRADLEFWEVVTS